MNSLLSRRSVLAIAAVVDVALHSRSAPVAARALAARHKLPPRHLETLLQGLVHIHFAFGITFSGKREGWFDFAARLRHKSRGTLEFHERRYLTVPRLVLQPSYSECRFARRPCFCESRPCSRWPCR